MGGPGAGRRSDRVFFFAEKIALEKLRKASDYTIILWTDIILSFSLFISQRLFLGEKYSGLELQKATG